MENVPKIVSQRLTVTPTAADHPDANGLTAFAERSLSEAERNKVLQHLARCVDCREIVSLALPAIEEVQAPVVLSQRGWPALRWGLALAGIVVIASFGAVLYQRNRHESMVAYKAPQAVTEAKNQAPSAAPAEQRTKTEAPQGSGAAAPSPAAEPSAKVTETLPQAEETAAGGVIHARRDALLTPTPQRHGPRVTNQLNQWQQNPNGIASAAPSAAAPPPVAKQAQGQLIANQRMPASSEAVQVETPSPSPNAQSDDQEALMVQNVPMLQQPSRSGYAATRVDKAKPADTGVSVVPPKVPAPYQAGSEKLASAGIPVWSIDSSGRLERSLDQGNTFQEVDVKATPVVARFSALKASEGAGKKDLAKAGAQANAPIVFRAVASNGLEVWAGGSAGQLYHSTDAGSHWSRVVPTFAGLTLTGDIVGIDFPDAQHGTISTSTPETWTTSDAGVTWQKQ